MFCIIKDNRKSIDSVYELVGTYETLQEAYDSGHCEFWEITTIYTLEDKTTMFVHARSTDINNKKYYIYPESTAKLFIE